MRLDEEILLNVINIICHSSIVLHLFLYTKLKLSNSNIKKKIIKMTKADKITKIKMKIYIKAHSKYE